MRDRHMSLLLDERFTPRSHATTRSWVCRSARHSGVNVCAILETAMTATTKRRVVFASTVGVTCGALLAACTGGGGIVPDIAAESADGGSADGNGKGDGASSVSEAGDARSDGATDDYPPEASTCVYPPVSNDSRCPATYRYSYFEQACSPIGLQCGYPGAGDGTPNGCWATASMWCRGDAGAGDGGSTASGSWIVAQ
jgi:hypothetical protein